MVEDFSALDETTARARLEALAHERFDLQNRLGLIDKYSKARAPLAKRLREIEIAQRALKNRLHVLAQAHYRPGTVKASALTREKTPAQDLPDEGFITQLMAQRAVVDAFKAAYKFEGEYLGMLIDEAKRRGFLDEEGNVKPIGALPHGSIPTLEEVGKPLGIVAGFHNSPGPHFPHHDTRRIYGGR